MDRLDSFRNLIIMAASDGRMAEAELRLLSHRATEWGITDDQFEDAIEASSRHEASLARLQEEDQSLLARHSELTRSHEINYLC